jgi:hypothetical protein
MADPSRVTNLRAATQFDQDTRSFLMLFGVVAVLLICNISGCQAMINVW